MGVDDAVFDFAELMFKHILREICVWSDLEFDEAYGIVESAPEELKDEWRSFLWDFDVRDFKPTEMFKEECRYHLICVIVDRAYDLKQVVAKYIYEEAKKRDDTKNK